MKRLLIKRRGFTLVELVLVLTVLAVLAGMVVPMVGGLEISTPYGQKSPEQIATEHTMQQIRDAIMGRPSRPGAWSDLGQRPETFAVFADPNVLLSEMPPLGLPGHLQNFDPVTRLGWRGPYLTGVTRLIDAWGNPLVMQIDVNADGVVDAFDLRYARLVSAGPDGILQTPVGSGVAVPGADPGSHLTLSEFGEDYDDLVLFFRTADVRQ